MSLRDSNLQRLKTEEFDVLIIGGGINGAVSSAALSAKGINVGLIDCRDFAGLTSQESSNLVWGGIKYMEGYEFGLVSELCRSRNELLRSFPSTVKEIRFLMSINNQFRFHPLVIFASTWIYWLLGRGKTQAPRWISSEKLKQIEPVINSETSKAGIEYSDAFLHDNDARFVFNFIRSAMDKGCAAVNYVESMKSSRNTEGSWNIVARDQINGEEFSIRSKILINATGSFVDSHNTLSAIDTNYQHLLSKGIHLIVPKLSENHRVLAFFADDERLFFAIPMANRTCIGTTDTRVANPISEVTDEDREFVLSNINQRLKLDRPLTKDDIIAERCGVRPLAVLKSNENAAQTQKLSRKHVIEIESSKNHISIFGGKLTDCLNVGNEICTQVSLLGLEFKDSGKWYGEPDIKTKEEYFERAKALGLSDIIAVDTKESMSTRLWRRYGVRANSMLDRIENDPSMVEPIIPNAGIRRCELEHLANNEMIVKLEDYLRRRSKIGLLQQKQDLKDSAGLREACDRFFGNQSNERFEEYFL